MSWTIVLLFLTTSCDQAAKDFASSVKSSSPLSDSSKATAQWSVSALTTQKSSAAVLTMTAQLASPLPVAVTVPFHLSGSAVLNQDFSLSSNLPLKIGAGLSSATFNLTILNNGVGGANKNIIVTMDQPINAALGERSVETITIVNNLNPSLAIVPSLTVVEGSIATFAVTLSPASSSTVSVQYSTSNGTALAGTNYSSSSGTLTFTGGVTTQNISVPTTDAGLYFITPKTFALTLSSATNALISSATSNGSIQANHAAPSVQWSLATQSSNKSLAATLTVTAQLSAAAGVNVTLPFTLGGTAILNTDYTITPASPLTILAGQTSVTTSVTIINDGAAGANKTVTLTLSPPTNASLGATTLQTITIVNDLVGAFNVSGITGAGDANLDAFLNGGVNPTVNWSSSLNATSYDVTIYQSNGSTVQCALVNTTLLSNNFSSCTLTAGQTYKAQVTAKGIGPSRNASNALYSFFVNSPPTVAVIATRFVMMNSSVATDVVTGASCAFAGCTISIASSANSANGTTSYSGNTITYTPSAAYTGLDSFSYVINDGRGGSATGTINLKVMSSFTWSGAGGNSSWATTNNWCGSLNAGSSACVGGPAPSTTDTAVFDATCVTNCSAIMNSNIDIAALFMYGGYTGTITQAAGFTILLRSASGFNQAGGTFIGGNSSITNNGDFNLSAGHFTSTSGTFTANSNFYITAPSGSFINNLGTINFTVGSTPATITAGSDAYYNMTFAGGYSTRTLAGTMTVNGVLTWNDSAINGGIIVAKGDANFNGYSGAGTSSVKIAGSTNQLISGITTSLIPNFELASTGGTVTLSGTLTFANNYTYTSGTVSPGTSTLQFTGYGNTNAIVPGTIAYNNVIFSGGYTTKTLSSNLIVNGNFTWNDGSSNGSSILVKGDFSCSGYAGGTSLLKIAGSTNQLLSGVGSCSIPDFEIASTGGTVTLSGNLIFASNYKYSSGTVTAGTSTVQFSGYGNTSAIIPGTIAYNNVTMTGGYTTKNLTGTMTVNGTLLFNDGTVSGGAFLANSDVQINPYGTPGSANITLAGTTPALFTMSSNGSNFTGNLTINKTGGGSVTLASNVSVNNSGQLTNITSGSLNIAGFNLTLNSLTLSGGTSISRNAGVLTVSGSSVPAGPYSGGTISN